MLEPVQLGVFLERAQVLGFSRGDSKKEGCKVNVG